MPVQDLEQWYAAGQHHNSTDNGSAPGEAAAGQLEAGRLVSSGKPQEEPVGSQQREAAAAQQSAEKSAQQATEEPAQQAAEDLPATTTPAASGSLSPTAGLPPPGTSRRCACPTATTAQEAHQQGGSAGHGTREVIGTPAADPSAPSTLGSTVPCIAEPTIRGSGGIRYAAGDVACGGGLHRSEALPGGQQPLGGGRAASHPVADVVASILRNVRHGVCM